MPFVKRGVKIVGLEPSCILTFRDELPALFPHHSRCAIASRQHADVRRVSDSSRARLAIAANCAATRSCMAIAIARRWPE